MRLRREGDSSALPDNGRPVIYCFWHEQLAMMPWVQFRPPTVVPISQSDDGEYTAELFRRLGVEPVRGSSSRGGANAARGLISAGRRGSDLGITVDGPRGPAKVVQPGAGWVARATGAALLPVAFGCTRAWRAGSWDKMLIPQPFARGVFVYGRHVWVPKDTPSGELPEVDRTLEERINEASERARAILLT